jgi:hypothetical protein
MKPIRIPTLSPQRFAALEELYRTTRDARVRTRAQMVLLAAERRMTAAEITQIVRQLLSDTCVLPANKRFFVVEPRGFELLTSAVQRRYDTLPEISDACKIPAS